MTAKFFVAGGISFGTALALAISYHVHQSIIFAIIHGFLGWLYVLWRAFTPG